MKRPKRLTRAQKIALSKAAAAKPQQKQEEKKK